MKPIRLIFICLALLLPAGLRSAAQGSAALLRAAAADELPLPAWGPYARGHIGPCCLVNRLLGQQFAFPIVISQQREETYIRSSRGPDGKLRAHIEPITLLRRSIGLAPILAFNDAIERDPIEDSREARLIEGDKEGLLWRSHIAFPPASVMQAVIEPPDPTGKPLPTPRWGRGEATVDYFPAFAEPAGDGLLIRISLTNLSDHDETYCVDLLGGMDAADPQFARKDLEITTDMQTGEVVLQHPHCKALFVLRSNPIPFHTYSYRVGDDFFGLDRNAAQRGPQGVLLPGPVLSRPGDVLPSPKQLSPPIPMMSAPDEVHGDWGLLRTPDIVVAPGKVTVLFLSVGVGQDPDGARESARTLLGVAEDRRPQGTLLEGAYTKAVQAHGAARYPTSDPVIARLMAQTLANAPLNGGKRLGVPIRSPNTSINNYEPETGGMIALAYASYEPLLAAAELNAYFLTNGDPNAPFTPPTAIAPTNLFALWELFQQTHSTALLARFYPFARRAYHEFLEAGRLKQNEWLFNWPVNFGTDASTSLILPRSLSKISNIDYRTSAPRADYAAYVIRAAKILRAMAVLLQRPEEERKEFALGAQQTAKALNEILWDEEHGVYDDSKTISALFPLIAGRDALPEARRKALLHILTGPEYWSAGGVRTLPNPLSPVVPYSNWLLWKGLLDLGEPETAKQIAQSMLHLYHEVQKLSLALPNVLDLSGNSPAVDDNYTGYSGAVIQMDAAYHISGTISTGWNIALLDQRYDARRRSLHCVYKNLEPERSAVILCALGKPGATYSLSGALTGTAHADADGVLTLHLPKDATTQVLDVAPVAGGEKGS